MNSVRVVVVAILGLHLAFASIVCAEAPAIKAGETLYKVMEGYKGKRVTVRLQGGEELTGKVKFVSKELLHLEELARREFFDAVIDVTKIEALIVRVKE